MASYEKALDVLNELFGHDCTFVLATVKDGAPAARVVDTFYENGRMWVVTHAKSNKMQEIAANPQVALCNSFHTFKGRAYNDGHPLKPENTEIRARLVQEFAPWYFAHNNEEDEGMCFARIELESGLYHKDGTAYKVDFIHKTTEEFPFAPDIEMHEQ